MRFSQDEGKKSCLSLYQIIRGNPEKWRLVTDTCQSHVSGRSQLSWREGGEIGGENSRFFSINRVEGTKLPRVGRRKVELWLFRCFLFFFAGKKINAYGQKCHTLFLLPLLLEAAITSEMMHIKRREQVNDSDRKSFFPGRVEQSRAEKNEFSKGRRKNLLVSVQKKFIAAAFSQL